MPGARNDLLGPDWPVEVWHSDKVSLNLMEAGWKPCYRIADGVWFNSLALTGFWLAMIETTFGGQPFKTGDFLVQDEAGVLSPYKASHFRELFKVAE